MKNKLANIIESLFSIFVIVAILGGGIVFIMFVIGKKVLKITKQTV